MCGEKDNKPQICGQRRQPDFGALGQCFLLPESECSSVGSSASRAGMRKATMGLKFLGPMVFAREPNDGGDGWGDDPCTPAVDEGANDDYGDLHITAGSRCIDAGDNTAVPDDTADLDDDSNTTEPVPWDFDGHPRFVDDPCTTNTGNGTPPIVDMGADEFPYLGDLNFSGCVNFVDYALFAKQWWKTACGGCGGADLTGDGNVDWNDVRRLAASWLAGCAP